jgi:hypothetical protein
MASEKGIKPRLREKHPRTDADMVNPWKMAGKAPAG